MRSHSFLCNLCQYSSLTSHGRVTREDVCLGDCTDCLGNCGRASTISRSRHQKGSSVMGRLLNCTCIGRVTPLSLLSGLGLRTSPSKISTIATGVCMFVGKYLQLGRYCELVNPVFQALRRGALVDIPKSHRRACRFWVTVLKCYSK